MIQRPKFKDIFHVEVVDTNIFLLTETQSWVLSGALYVKLAPFLSNGQNYAVSEIVEKLSDEFPSLQIYYALNQLEKLGYIIEANEDVSPEQAAFWQSLGIDGGTAEKQVKETAVTITTLGDVDDQPLREALTASNVRLGDDGDLQIVLVDDYLHPGLADINRQALERDRPWMLARLRGMSAWFGPIFQPGQSACWACLANRIEINRQLDAYILRQTKSTEPLPTARAALPTTYQIGANMLATEILKWMANHRKSTLGNNLFTYNVIWGQLEKHFVVKRPQCPVCGDPEKYEKMAPVELVSQKPKLGSSRTVSPEETFRRYEHHVSSISGIVTWLVDTSGQTDGMMHNYSAGHSFAIARDTLDYLSELLKGRTGGKGRTNSQAKAAAVCEALERYSGVFRGDEYRIKSSYKALGSKAIHVNSIMNFSEKQYAVRDEWNANLDGTRFNVVPNPFDEDLEIDWSPVWSLTHNEFKYIPTAFCFYGHPETVDYFYCLCDSNGVAAGNTKEEAIRSGYMELVERDGLAMWWYNRSQRPRVDLDSFNEPYLNDLQAFYRQKLNRDLWAIDITTDIQIPAFVVLSRRLDRHPEDIIFGSSADLDPVKALLGAATECNQFLPAIMREKEDGSTDYIVHDPAAISWWTTATAESQSYLLPDPNLPPKKLSDYTPLHSNDLKEDIETCLRLTSQLGLETLVLEQTRPDIGLPVWKVMVPQLRHFWRRLGPGRLFDVPVKEGWLSEPLTEAELNPISIFY